MIEISLQCGTFLIFNVLDWERIRKEFRIVGELIGNTQSSSALPLRLTPEECLFLIKKGIAKLVKYDYDETSSSKSEYDAFVDDLFVEEQKLHREVRKQDLEKLIDKIVAGKKSKGDTRTKEEIFEEELDKSADMNKEVMIWPIFTSDPSFIKRSSTDVSSDVVAKLTTPLKIAVFSDLWEKGYYITSGMKFGGDFLAYLGDPVLYHAVYIVRCVEKEEDLHSSDVVAFGRLGTTVKKKAVLASLVDNTVIYITLKWIDA